MPGRTILISPITGWREPQSQPLSHGRRRLTAGGSRGSPDATPAAGADAWAMDHAQAQRGVRRPFRCVPFVVVALCFLLPFFSASSCGSGRHTTATGVDIITGAQLVAQQTRQPLLYGGHVELGPIGPDPEAQAVSREARPWTIIALALAMLGAVLVVVLRRHWRAASAVAATATLAALIQVESAFHAPRQDISSDTGLMLAYTILFGTAIWQIGAVIHWLVANRRAVSAVARNAPLDRPGDRRSLS